MMGLTPPPDFWYCLCSCFTRLSVCSVEKLLLHTSHTSRCVGITYESCKNAVCISAVLGFSSKLSDKAKLWVHRTYFEQQGTTSSYHVSGGNPHFISICVLISILNLNSIQLTFNGHNSKANQHKEKINPTYSH